MLGQEKKNTMRIILHTTLIQSSNVPSSSNRLERQTAAALSFPVAMKVFPQDELCSDWSLICIL